MAYPYGPQDVIPFGMLPDDIGPEAMGLSDLQAPQEPLPQDFFARLAQASGPQPFSFQPGRKPTGLEVLLAIASGVGNVAAGRGAQRTAAVQDRNTQAREAAKTLATWRHQERLERQRREDARIAAREAREAKPPPGPEATENVIDPKTGKAIKVPRSKSYGMEPAYPPAQYLTGPKPRNATAAELDQLTVDASILKQINKAKKSYRKGYTGLIAGRTRGIAVATGRGDPGEAAFRSNLAQIRNEVLKARSGGAVTPSEAKRLLDELPTVNDENFVEKLNEWEDNWRSRAATRRATLEQGGVMLDRISSLPSTGPWTGTKIRMRSPDGQLYEVDESERGEAEANGWEVAP